MQGFGVWKWKRQARHQKSASAQLPFGTLTFCWCVFASSSLKSVCSVFLKYHQIFPTSFRLKQVPKVRLVLWVEVEIDFFLIFSLVNDRKRKVLASPFGLEHLVLIVLCWQPLALCLEEKSLLLPWTILQRLAAHLAVPSGWIVPEGHVRSSLWTQVLSHFPQMLLPPHPRPPTPAMSQGVCLSQNTLSGVPDSHQWVKWALLPSVSGQDSGGIQSEVDRT